MSIWLGLLVAVSICAQPLSVYSEFAIIDPTGRVTAPENPREILSPALVRNGFTSFQIVVEAGSDVHWRLHVGQNPENAVRATLYREMGDALDPVELPVEGDGSQVFWIDLWAERTAPVARIKVEPELFINNDWVTYPMEGRVVEATVPAAGKSPVTMKAYLCGGSAPASAPSSAAARLRSRNEQQDVALASRGSTAEIKKLYGSCGASPPQDPEWYLRIRDYLFRLR